MSMIQEFFKVYCQEVGAIVFPIEQYYYKPLLWFHEYNLTPEQCMAIGAIIPYLPGMTSIELV